uniref:BESS domain-containing protein n=1 Tax=Oncorhynchus tshawytscha TaxID=74940 RepID=A0A8C8M2A9_ONCTS
MQMINRLYNITLNSYKDSQRKARARRAVTLQVEMPVDDCQKKWKNPRDTLVRFKQAEEQRKASGEPDSYKKNWMHSRRMSFLTPFIQAKSWQGDTTLDLEDRGNKEMERNGESADDEDAPSPDTASGSYGPSQKRRWQMDGMDGMEDIEDEMFFSLLPYFRKLPHGKKNAVKLKIHQLLHEAAFQ